MRPLLNQVTIVGLGLIGGSLGMAVKKRRLPGRFLKRPSSPLLDDCSNFQYTRMWEYWNLERRGYG